MIRALTQKDLPALKGLLNYSFSLDEAYLRRQHSPDRICSTDFSASLPHPRQLLYPPKFPP